MRETLSLALVHRARREHRGRAGEPGLDVGAALGDEAVAARRGAPPRLRRREEQRRDLGRVVGERDHRDAIGRLQHRDQAIDGLDDVLDGRACHGARRVDGEDDGERRPRQLDPRRGGGHLVAACRLRSSRASVSPRAWDVML